MTLAYLFVSGKPIDPLRSAVFFGGMFLFDLTATTINNYHDTKKNQQVLAFSRPVALAVTWALLLASAACGLWLVYLTDLVVLAAGLVCFLFGVLYSWGPVPISHGPYGEMISGLFYGAVIPFILIQANAPGWLLSYTIAWDEVTLSLQPVPVIGFLLLAVLPSCLTANIMLANNVCDVERDVRVQRFTLAYYLKSHALTLFALIYYAAYASVVAMVIFGYLPYVSLALLFTLIPVQKNIRVFMRMQIKEETFIVSIRNFVLILSAHTLLIFLGGFLPGWGR